MEIYITLQIFVEDELKLPIGLFLIAQKDCRCCRSCLQLMALFTAKFIKKMLFLRVNEEDNVS